MDNEGTSCPPGEREMVASSAAVLNGVRLEVSPREALLTEPVHVRVEGLSPGEKVTLRMQAKDMEGQIWRGEGVFLADERGEVDPSHQPSLGGTYEGLDPLGLLWSATPMKEEIRPSTFRKLSSHPIPAQVELILSSGTRLHCEFTRTCYSSQVERVEVRDDGIIATAFVPEGEGPFPGILALGGSGGGMQEIEAALLASAGFVALSAAYFGVDPLPKECFHIPVESFQGAVDWLSHHKKVKKDALGVVGWSAGGQLALLLASHYPQFRCAVNFMGAPMVTTGYGTGMEQRSSWSKGGKPLPFLPISLDCIDFTPPISGTPGYLASMEDEELLEAAMIPVENIQGPILMLTSPEDQTWPCDLACKKAVERLNKKGFSHEVQHLSYEQAGHLIHLPNMPTTLSYVYHKVLDRTIAFGGRPKEAHDAAGDAWKRMVEFFRKHLGD